MRLGSLFLITCFFSVVFAPVSEPAYAQSSSSHCVTSIYVNGEQRWENVCGYGVVGHWYHNGSKRSWYFPPGERQPNLSGFRTSFTIICKRDGEKIVWIGNVPSRCEKL